MFGLGYDWGTPWEGIQDAWNKLELRVKNNDLDGIKQYLADLQPGDLQLVVARLLPVALASSQLEMVTLLLKLDTKMTLTGTDACLDALWDRVTKDEAMDGCVDPVWSEIKLEMDRQGNERRFVEMDCLTAKRYPRLFRIRNFVNQLPANEFPAIMCQLFGVALKHGSPNTIKVYIKMGADVKANLPNGCSPIRALVHRYQRQDKADVNYMDISQFQDLLWLLYSLGSCPLQDQWLLPVCTDFWMNSVTAKEEGVYDTILSFLTIGQHQRFRCGTFQEAVHSQRLSDSFAIAYQLNHLDTRDCIEWLQARCLRVTNTSVDGKVFGHTVQLLLDNYHKHTSCFINDALIELPSDLARLVINYALPQMTIDDIAHPTNQQSNGVLLVSNTP
jgi:hypothetical protein